MWKVLARVLLPLSWIAGLAVGTQAQSNGGLPPGIISKEEPRTFEEAVDKINASQRFFEALARQTYSEPSINLNLLRYRPRGDSTRYMEYAVVAAPEIRSLGGSVPLFGSAITAGPPELRLSDEWDEIAWAVFPRPSAYLALQQSRAYQGAIPDRVAGTYERMLYILTDQDPIYEASYSIRTLYESKATIPLDPENVVVSEFLRFREPRGRGAYGEFAREFSAMLRAAGGEVLLSANTLMPILSEEYWDHFVSFRFPSAKALDQLYRSRGYQRAKALRNDAIEAALTVASRPNDVLNSPK